MVLEQGARGGNRTANPKRKRPLSWDYVAEKARARRRPTTKPPRRPGPGAEPGATGNGGAQGRGEAAPPAPCQYGSARPQAHQGARVRGPGGAHGIGYVLPVDQPRATKPGANLDRRGSRMAPGNVASVVRSRDREGRPSNSEGPCVPLVCNRPAGQKVDGRRVAGCERAGQGPCEGGRELSC